MPGIFDRIAPYYNKIISENSYPLEKEMDIQKNEKVLDVGGGTGRLAEKIVNNSGAEVTILDASAQMLRRVKSLSQIKTVKGEIENSPFQDNSFDIIICIDVLHHLGNPEKGIKEISRLLKPKGKIYIQDFDVKKFRTKILMFFEKYLLREPANFYSPEELSKLLKEKGFNGSFKYIPNVQYLYVGEKRE